MLRATAPSPNAGAPDRAAIGIDRLDEERGLAADDLHLKRPAGHRCRGGVSRCRRGRLTRCCSGSTELLRVSHGGSNACLRVESGPLFRRHVEELELWRASASVISPLGLGMSVMVGPS